MQNTQVLMIVVTSRGLKEADMATIVGFIDRVISNPNDEANLETIGEEVREMMSHLPLFSW